MKFIKPEHHGKHILGLWIAAIILGTVGLYIWHSYLASNPFGG